MLEDLFNLYVSLEVLSLFASLLYLFGIAIIYASNGSLSMHMLAISFSDGGEFISTLKHRVPGKLNLWTSWRTGYILQMLLAYSTLAQIGYLLLIVSL